MKVPCKNCAKRTVGCHAECREYREFQSENEKIKKNRKNDIINRSTTFWEKVLQLSVDNPNTMCYNLL